MKKFLMLLLAVVMIGALAACGGDDKDKDKDADKTPPASETETPDAGETEAPEATGNEYYDSVVTILTDAGYEVANAHVDEELDFFTDTVSSFSIEINQEDMLPLQMYQIKADSEHLATAKETGMGQAGFEGEVFESEVVVIGDYYFFLGEGHPDSEAVITLLKEKLQ